MITLYRLIKKKWAANAFDGEGARLFGGRWNNKGKACVYCAASESLAILEVLVHLNRQDIIDHYVPYQLTIDESKVLRLDWANIPSNWRDNPAPYETADIGDQWLQLNASLALAVPSTIVPREWNYLLNPNHPDFTEAVAQARQLDFSFDPRL